MAKTIEEKKIEIETELLNFPNEVQRARKKILENISLSNEVITKNATSLLNDYPSIIQNMATLRHYLYGFNGGQWTPYDFNNSTDWNTYSDSLSNFSFPSLSKFAYQAFDVNGDTLTLEASHNLVTQNDKLLKFVDDPQSFNLSPITSFKNISNLPSSNKVITYQLSKNLYTKQGFVKRRSDGKSLFKFLRDSDEVFDVSGERLLDEENSSYSITDRTLTLTFYNSFDQPIEMYAEYEYYDELDDTELILTKTPMDFRNDPMFVYTATFGNVPDKSNIYIYVDGEQKGIYSEKFGFGGLSLTPADCTLNDTRITLRFTDDLLDKEVKIGYKELFTATIDETVASYNEESVNIVGNLDKEYVYWKNFTLLTGHKDSAIDTYSTENVSIDSSGTLTGDINGYVVTGSVNLTSGDFSITIDNSPNYVTFPEDYVLRCEFAYINGVDNWISKNTFATFTTSVENLIDKMTLDTPVTELPVLLDYYPLMDTITYEVVGNVVIVCEGLFVNQSWDAYIGTFDDVMNMSNVDFNNALGLYDYNENNDIMKSIVNTSAKSTPELNPFWPYVEGAHEDVNGVYGLDGKTPMVGNYIIWEYNGSSYTIADIIRSDSRWNHAIVDWATVSPSGAPPTNKIDQYNPYRYSEFFESTIRQIKENTFSNSNVIIPQDEDEPSPLLEGSTYHTYHIVSGKIVDRTHTYDLVETTWNTSDVFYSCLFNEIVDLLDVSVNNSVDASSQIETYIDNMNTLIDNLYTTIGDINTLDTIDNTSVDSDFKTKFLAFKSVWDIWTGYISSGYLTGFDTTTSTWPAMDMTSWDNLVLDTFEDDLSTYIESIKTRLGGIEVFSADTFTAGYIKTLYTEVSAMIGAGINYFKDVVSDVIKLNDLEEILNGNQDKYKFFNS